LFLAFALPLLGVVLLSPKFPETRYALVNKFIQVLNGWNLICSHKRIITKISLLSAALLLVNTVSGMISFSLFGIHITFFQALFMSALGTLAIIISITPAGLGIQEAVSVFSAMVIGLTPAQSLPVAILGRVVGMLVIFTLGPIFSYVLLNHRPAVEKTPETVEHSGNDYDKQNNEEHA
jgi:uncharacterized membrane protein YbhN (UPF0104 family)